MKLDVETLREAFGEAEEFWKEYKTEEAPEVSAESLIGRMKLAAVVKAFEFTYEPSARFIRRQLSEGTLTGEEIRAMSFRFARQRDGATIFRPRSCVDDGGTSGYQPHGRSSGGFHRI